MSTINIQRVELSARETQAIVEQGHRVRETPHQGGPYNRKYALTLGGLASHVVIVDTIKAGRDHFGRTQDVAGVRILSNTESERIPAAATTRVVLLDAGKRTAEQRTYELLQVGQSIGVDIGQFIHDGAVDFVALHKRCTELAVASNVSVTTFAELWRSSGDAGLAMMHYMAEHGMLERWYDSTRGEIVSAQNENQVALLQSEGSYFNSEVAHGALPPVEAMFAIEAVMAILQGRDVTYDHLYVRSTEYTKDDAVTDRIQDIALGTLALMEACGAVDYRFVIADNAQWDAIGGDCDHFAMVRAGNRYDANALISRWDGEQQ